jgi:hypothetical protein
MNEHIHFQKCLKFDPMIGRPVLKNLCSAFLHFTHGHLILVSGFGHGKVHLQNNCVWFWV